MRNTHHPTKGVPYLNIKSNVYDGYANEGYGNSGYWGR